MTWLVGLVAVVLLSSVGTAQDPARRPDLRAVPGDLLDGDLVFRRGIDAVSRIALSYGDQPRFSHVGVITRAGGELNVIHAVPASLEYPGGVRRDSLLDFIAPDSAVDVAYYRFDAIFESQREVIRGYLMAAVGTPFDYQFRYTDDSALYCSEVVVKALRAVGADIVPELATVDGVMLSEPVIPPDAIIGSGLFRRLTP